MVEKVLLPNPQVLMWTIDRVDPQPRVPEPEAPHCSTPELTDAEAIADAAKHYDLLAETIRTMAALGYPVRRLIEQNTIDTTSSPAPAEPAVEANASPKEDSEPAPTPSDTPIATCIEPAEPAKPPSVDEAF